MRFGTGESLDDIVKRAALPIHVDAGKHRMWIWRRLSPRSRVYVSNYATPSEATRAYLSLVHQLQSAQSTSPAASLSGCAANSAVELAPAASSSQSAAPRPKLATSPADAADASPATAAAAGCSSPGQPAATDSPPRVPGMQGCL